jgi:hypothetical protein
MQDDQFDKLSIYQKEVVHLLGRIHLALWFLIGTAVAAMAFWRWG